MIKVHDDMAIPFIMDKMRDKCLTDNFDNDIHKYINEVHDNFFTKDGGGFMCLSYHSEYILANYTWRDDSFSNHKELVKFAKFLYSKYSTKYLNILYPLLLIVL